MVYNINYKTVCKLKRRENDILFEEYGQRKRLSIKTVSMLKYVIKVTLLQTLHRHIFHSSFIRKLTQYTASRVIKKEDLYEG